MNRAAVYVVALRAISTALLFSIVSCTANVPSTVSSEQAVLRDRALNAIKYEMKLRHKAETKAVANGFLSESDTPLADLKENGHVVALQNAVARGMSSRTSENLQRSILWQRSVMKHLRFYIELAHAQLSKPLLL